MSRRLKIRSVLLPGVSRECSGISDELLVDCDVIIGHALGGEPLIEHLTASMAIDRAELVHLAHHFIKIVADEARHAMTNDFRDRPPSVGEDGSPAGKTFDQHQAKRLRPIIGADQPDSVPDKIALLRVGNLSHKLNQGVVKERLHNPLEIGTVGRVDLCSHLQGQSNAFGQLNGLVRAFFRRDPSEKSQVLARLCVKFIQIFR